MTKHVLTLAVCTGFMPNLFAQTLPRLSHSERFQWNGEPTALQATAGVLSEKPSLPMCIHARESWALMTSR
jgi:hypothetical protein